MSSRRRPGVLPARRVDLSGRIALHFGKGNIAGPAEAINFANGADLSTGGRTIFALPSRNLKGSPNIRVSVAALPNRYRGQLQFLPIINTPLLFIAPLQNEATELPLSDGLIDLARDGVGRDRVAPGAADAVQSPGTIAQTGECV